MRVPGQHSLTLPGGPQAVLLAVHILQRGPVSSWIVYPEKTPSVRGWERVGGVHQ